jgi:hypothetical protein
MSVECIILFGTAKNFCWDRIPIESMNAEKVPTFSAFILTTVLEFGHWPVEFVYDETRQLKAELYLYSFTVDTRVRSHAPSIRSHRGTKVV